MEIKMETFVPKFSQHVETIMENISGKVGNGTSATIYNLLKKYNIPISAPSPPP